MAQSVKRKKAQAGWRFRGITKDAQVLGVTRPHLYLVLSGKRQSKRLLSRYKALKIKQQEPAR